MVAILFGRVLRTVTINLIAGTDFSYLKYSAIIEGYSGQSAVR